MKIANNCTVIWRNYEDYKNYILEVADGSYLDALDSHFGQDNIVSVVEISDRDDEVGNYLGVILKDGTCGITGHKMLKNRNIQATVYMNLTLEQMYGKLIILNYVD